MHFPVNEELLRNAHGILSGRRGIYWIIGGACAGKSTICQAISRKHNIPIYDMDAHIYDRYQHRYTQERHPANRAWLTAENGLAWALSLSWDDFDAFNRAANAEYLDLLAEDLKETGTDSNLLIDGGISNPAILAQAMPTDQTVCLEIPECMSARIWEESEDRRFMKEMVHQLPNPREMWSKFLHFDVQITRTISRECRENAIRTFLRDEDTPVDALAEQITIFFGIP